MGLNRSERSGLPLVTLLALALAAGIGWRVELEMRSGWASLAWLSYFHWAIPIFVAGFIVWVVVWTPVRHRLAFIAALIAFAVLGIIFTERALRTIFVAGPAAAFTAMMLGHGDFALGISQLQFWKSASIGIWLLIPLCFLLLCRLFGAPITIIRACVSVALFTFSWPLAVFVRGFVEQQGSADLIHALKSGFLIPFLVVALGIPLLPAKPQPVLPTSS